MGSRQLVEHMGVRGVLTSQVKQFYTDSPILNKSVAMSGDPKAPFLPMRYDHSKPRQSNKATAEMLATLNANQVYLREKAPMPGLSTNAANVRPVLIATYEMKRRQMYVNDLHMRQSPVYRPVGVPKPAGA
jgi:hypothetical protein